MGTDLGLIEYKVLKVCGLGESRVDEQIGDLIRGSTNPVIGLLASPGEIRIRLTARGKNRKATQSLIGRSGYGDCSGLAPENVTPPLNGKGSIMSGLVKFLIRAVIGAGLAVLMSRFFFHRLSLFTVLIAIFLVGMAYVSESVRKRDQ